MGVMSWMKGSPEGTEAERPLARVSLPRDDITPMTTEIWKDIPGFEGRYQASDLGRVRSADRTVWCRSPDGGVHQRTYRGKVLRPAAHLTGHLMVMRGRKKNIDVHVAVMLAFEGAPPAGHEVLHENHDPADNRKSNLRYGTRSENLKMDYAAGRRQRGHAKLTRWKKP